MAQNELRQERLERLDSIMAEAISDGTIPGAVVSVVRGDKIAYLKAYGNKSLVPEVEPMSVETVFDLASDSFLHAIDRERVSPTD